MKELKNKIIDKKAVVGIIGLGYVGLPLAVTFAKGGFKVYGIDIDKHRVERLKEGETHILDVSIDDVKSTMRSKKFIPTTDPSVIKEVDAVIICVPTPLNKTKEPDVSFIVSAVDSIKKHMKRGQIIVLESTTYPGTTDEVMLPVLEAGGMKEGKDF
ncbi:MAG TPA: NAD(P)-binding domain-containing protein, partial [Candidatus Omnitrophota bacterium]|nr:NAD(P)-binding domain-containing protein [Candidatus Omnitrophota bacterium]